jgi:hypothetical protein
MSNINSKLGIFQGKHYFDNLSERGYEKRLSPLKYQTVQGKNGSIALTDRKVNILTFFFKKVSIFVVRLFLAIFSKHHHWDNDKRLVKHLNKHLSTYFEKSQGISRKEFALSFADRKITNEPSLQVLKSIENIYNQLILRQSENPKLTNKLSLTKKAIEALKKTSYPGDGGRKNQRARNSRNQHNIGVSTHANKDQSVVSDTKLTKNNPELRSAEATKNKDPNVPSRTRLEKNNPDLRSAEATKNKDPKVPSRTRLAKNNPDLRSAEATKNKDPNVPSRTRLEKNNPDLRSAEATKNKDPKVPSRTRLAKNNPDLRSAEATKNKDPKVPSRTRLAKNNPDLRSAEATKNKDPNVPSRTRLAKNNPYFSDTYAEIKKNQMEKLSAEAKSDRNPLSDTDFENLNFELFFFSAKEMNGSSDSSLVARASKITNVFSRSKSDQVLRSMKNLPEKLSTIPHTLFAHDFTKPSNLNELARYLQMVVSFENNTARTRIDEETLAFIKEFKKKTEEVFSFVYQKAIKDALTTHSEFIKVFPKEYSSSHFDPSSGLTTLSIAQFKTARGLLQSRFGHLLRIIHTEEHRCQIAKLMQLIVLGPEVAEVAPPVSSCCFQIQEFAGKFDRGTPYPIESGKSFIHFFIEQKFAKVATEDAIFKDNLEGERGAVWQFGRDAFNSPCHLRVEGTKYSIAPSSDPLVQLPLFFPLMNKKYVAYLIENPDQAKLILEMRLKNPFFEKVKSLCGPEGKDDSPSLFFKSTFLKLLEKLKKTIEENPRYKEAYESIVDAGEIDPNLIDKLNGFTKDDIESLLRMKIVELILIHVQSRNLISTGLATTFATEYRSNVSGSSAIITAKVSDSETKFVDSAFEYIQFLTFGKFAITDPENGLEKEGITSIVPRDGLSIIEFNAELAVPSLGRIVLDGLNGTVKPSEITSDSIIEPRFSWETPDSVIQYFKEFNSTSNINPQLNVEIDPEKQLQEINATLLHIAKYLNEKSKLVRDEKNNFFVVSRAPHPSQASSSQSKSGISNESESETLEHFSEYLKTIPDLIFSLKQKKLIENKLSTVVTFLEKLRNPLFQVILSLDNIELGASVIKEKEWLLDNEPLTIYKESQQVGDKIQDIQTYIWDEIIPLLPKPKPGLFDFVHFSFFNSTNPEHIDWKVHNYEQVLTQLSTHLESIKKENGFTSLGSSNNSLHAAIDKIFTVLAPIKKTPAHYNQEYLLALRNTYKNGFVRNLRAAVELAEQCKNPSEEDLKYINIIHQICESLYTKINLESEALELVEKMNSAGEKNLTHSSGNAKILSDGSVDLTARSHVLHHNIINAGRGLKTPLVHQLLNSLRGTLTTFGFDPATQGNPLMKLYNLKISKEGLTKDVIGLGMGTPTKEGKRNYAEITSEFKGFLRSYKVQGKSHLYINNQNFLGKEADRCGKLMNLQESHEFAGTFFGITLSKNSSFYSTGGKNDSAREFKNELLAQVFDTALLKISGNYISPEVREVYSENTGIQLRNHSEVLCALIHQHLFGVEKVTLTEEERKLFIEVFYDHLEEMIIVGLNVNSFNISCKDAIDRGAASNAQLYARLALLNSVGAEGKKGIPITSAQAKKYDMLREARALMVRKRPIIDERHERATKTVTFMQANKEALSAIHNARALFDKTQVIAI